MSAMKVHLLKRLGLKRFCLRGNANHDGRSREQEPRLKVRRFAIRAEGHSVSEGSKVYERENSRVSRSARLKDFLSF